MDDIAYEISLVESCGSFLLLFLFLSSISILMHTNAPNAFCVVFNKVISSSDGAAIYLQLYEYEFVYKLINILFDIYVQCTSVRTFMPLGVTPCVCIHVLSYSVYVYA